MAKNEFGRWAYTEEEIERQITEARRRSVRVSRSGLQASRAFYDAEKDRIVIECENGVTFSHPAAQIEGLEDASPEERSNVALSPLGNSLRWEHLDLDLGVTELAAGILGTRAWMAELGRKGGRSTSIEKAKAARINGRKGGRPRKPARVAASANVIRVPAWPGRAGRGAVLEASLAVEEGKPLTPSRIEWVRAAIEGNGDVVERQTVKLELPERTERVSLSRVWLSLSVPPIGQAGQEENDAGLAVAA